MTKMIGKTKDGQQVQIQVDEQGRVVVVVVVEGAERVEKPETLIQRLVKRVRGKRG